MGRKLDIALAILNGTLGDHLARTGNALATETTFAHEGEPLPSTREAFARAYPRATPLVAVFVHGVMSTESVWTFADGHSSYGSLLARDSGVTPLLVRYNSGRAIADSGAGLAALLDALPSIYPATAPLERILLVGHSMGGLVIRAACHTAKTREDPSLWLPLVERVIYVGTPHLGAPLERLGRVVSKVLRTVDDPYTRLVADIADLRSEGIQDLGDADVRHEDRARRRGGLSLRDARHPVPLLPELEHFLLAGSLSSAPLVTALFGDALVPVASATHVARREEEEEVETASARDAAEALPRSHVKLLPGIGHLALAHHPAVYAQLLEWTKDSMEKTR